MVERELFMKRLFILASLISIFIITSACSNKYEGYKLVDLPDEKTGSLRIPNNWEIIVNDDGWINIIDGNTDSLLGVQYYYGEYYNIGKTNYDTRIYNPYFDNYNFIENAVKSGNSNQAQWGVYTLEVDEEQIEIIYLFFSGKNSSYQIEVIIIEKTINSLILDKIAKSYKRYE